MVGRNKSRTYWRVLKIDRLEPCELNIREDCTTYSERECSDLLRRIHEGNKSTGGLKFVTTCYGIVGMSTFDVHILIPTQTLYLEISWLCLFLGFIKFLGPYYMLLITKRRSIGAICGHTIYAVSKSEIIPLPNPAVRTNVVNSKNENRFFPSPCRLAINQNQK